jgi:tetratricopeptide (TPR) repeat protein
VIGKVKQDQVLEDKIIRYVLILIWIMLLGFGYISILKPARLLAFSEIGKSMEAQQSINKANEAFKDRNYKLALNSYKEALEIQPKMEEAIIGLGVTYSKLGMYEKAISIFKKKLKEAPENPYALYYNLAEIHEKKGKMDEAVGYYSKSAETAPIAFYSFGKIGEMYFSYKGWDQAIQYYNKADASKPDMKISYEGMLKSELINYSDPEIIESIKELVSNGFDEDFQNYYYSDRFEKVLAKDKNLANIYNNIGFAHAMKDEMEDAILWFRKALKIWPASKRARQDLKTALEIQQSKLESIN